MIKLKTIKEDNYLFMQWVTLVDLRDALNLLFSFLYFVYLSFKASLFIPIRLLMMFPFFKKKLELRLLYMRFENFMYQFPKNKIPWNDKLKYIDLIFEDYNRLESYFEKTGKHGDQSSCPNFSSVIVAVFNEFHKIDENYSLSAINAALESIETIHGRVLFLESLLKNLHTEETRFLADNDIEFLKNGLISELEHQKVISQMPKPMGIKSEKLKNINRIIWNSSKNASENDLLSVFHFLYQKGFIDERNLSIKMRQIVTLLSKHPHRFIFGVRLVNPYLLR